MAITKRLLSGSTQGKGIKVAAVAATGTLLHTAVSGTTNFDEIWVYAVNTATATRKVTVEFGVTNLVSGQVEYSIPSEDGAHLIVPGWLLHNALVVRAFATVANQVIAHGYVNRIV